MLVVDTCMNHVSVSPTYGNGPTQLRTKKNSDEGGN